MESADSMEPLPDEIDVRPLSDTLLDELMNNAGTKAETASEAQAELRSLRGNYRMCFHGKSDCFVVKPTLLKKINGWKAYIELQRREANGRTFLKVHAPQHREAKSNLASSGH